MSSTFNLLDLIFIAFTLIFVLAAFFRGFIKEVFSLFNWSISLIASHIFTPYLAEFLYRYSDSKMAIDAGVRVIIFISVFLLVAISTANLSRSLKEKTPKIFDRSLGVLFGIIKTLLIAGVSYSISLNFLAFALGKSNKEAEQKMPIWVREAKCHSILEFSGSVIDPLVKKFIDSLTKNFDEVTEKTDEFNEKIDDIIKEKSVEKVADEVKENTKNLDSGYNKKDLEKMNRLIEIVQ